MGRYIPWMDGEAKKSSPSKRQGKSPKNNTPQKVERDVSPITEATHSSRPATAADGGRKKEKVPKEPMIAGTDADDRYIMVVEELDEVCDLVAKERYGAIARGLELDKSRPSDRSLPPTAARVQQVKANLAANAAAKAQRREDAAYIRMLMKPQNSRTAPPISTWEKPLRAIITEGSAPVDALPTPPRASRPAEELPQVNMAPAARPTAARSARPAPPPPKPAPAVKPEDDSFNLDFMFNDASPVNSAAAARPKQIAKRRLNKSQPRTPSPTARSRTRSALSVSPEPAQGKADLNPPQRKKTISLRDTMKW